MGIVLTDLILPLAFLTKNVHFCVVKSHLFPVIILGRLVFRSTWEGLGHSLVLEPNGRGIVFPTSKKSISIEPLNIFRVRIRLYKSRDSCHAGDWQKLLPVELSHFFFHLGKAFALSACQVRKLTNLCLEAMSLEKKKSLNARILLSKSRCLGYKGCPNWTLWREQQMDGHSRTACCEMHSLRRMVL